MEINLVKRVLDNGGSIKPLIVPFEESGGTGVTNPSIYIDNGNILVNLRHLNYEIYHSEFDQKYPSWSGPLIYLHREDDVCLRTTNYLSKLNEDLDIVQIDKVDTSALDVKPKWTFIGLEDARVVRWDDRLFLIGVRRDTTDNGQGRMEFSEVQYVDGRLIEVSRDRIAAPGTNDSYCEKNWMPVIDEPYTFVKWTNPIEVVKVDLQSKTSETIKLGETTFPAQLDFRGSSQVLKLNDQYLFLIHETDFWYNAAKQKEAHYYTRFVVYDKDWNFVKHSKRFKYMDNNVEFTCGLALHQDHFLMPFGTQDNSAYILKAPLQFILDFIDEQ